MVDVRRDVAVDVFALLSSQLMVVNLRLLALTSVGSGGVVVLAGSVHHGMKSVLVRAVPDDPDAAARLLHAVLAGHAAPCERNDRGRILAAKPIPGAVTRRNCLPEKFWPEWLLA